MQLGNFSVSLAVRDIKASRAFYEKLGFVATCDMEGQNWMILRNGACILALFQGMFDKNILTFNPGWDGEARTLESFEDVRQIQKRLKASGVALTHETDDAGTGPAHITLIDPDGNPILIDQHVPRPT